MQTRILAGYIRSASQPPAHKKLSLSWRWRVMTHVVLFATSAAFGIFLAARYLFASPAAEADTILFVERSVSLSTGYSVLPALLLMSGSFLVYACFALKRDFLGERFKVDCPYPRIEGDQDQSSPMARVCHEISELSEYVREDLIDFAGYRWRHRHLLMIACVLFVPAT